LKASDEFGSINSTGTTVVSDSDAWGTPSMTSNLLYNTIS